MCWNKYVNSFFLQLGSLYFNSRDEVRVISHLLLKSLQEGEICGFTWPQTLFILHTIEQHRWYLFPVQTHTLQTDIHTSMDMIPLCFSSTRSQMILLLKN